MVIFLSPTTDLFSFCSFLLCKIKVVTKFIHEHIAVTIACYIYALEGEIIKSDMKIDPNIRGEVEKFSALPT